MCSSVPPSNKNYMPTCVRVKNKKIKGKQYNRRRFRKGNTVQGVNTIVMMSMRAYLCRREVSFLVVLECVRGCIARETSGVSMMSMRLCPNGEGMCGETRSREVPRTVSTSRARDQTSSTEYGKVVCGAPKARRRDRQRDRLDSRANSPTSQSCECYHHRPLCVW